MKLNTFFIALVLMAFKMSCAQEQSSQDRNELERIRNQIEILSSDTLEGRRAGSKGAERAQSFIIQALKKFEIDPLDSQYLYPFSFYDIGIKEKKKKQLTHANNIVGYIDNGQERSIVIGAHYDHLGIGFHPNSRSTGKSPLHHGADDNASGVVAALEIARKIRQNETIEDFNFIIIFFSAEESGLIGSKAWIQEWNKKLDIAAMINLDMVGRMSERTVHVFGYGTSPSWFNFQQNLTSTIKWEVDSSGLGPSDHASFYLADIPAIYFFTGHHADYHKESDTPEKINYAGLIDLKNAVYEALIITSVDAPFEFTKTANNQAKKRPELRVSMGIIPSYSSTTNGLLIDGVLSGKPAEKALLKKGDVIIQIEDWKVKDIYDYMEVLAQFDQGDEVTVQIIRQNQRKNLKLKF